MGSRAWPPKRPTTRAGRQEVTGRFSAALLAKVAAQAPWRRLAACAGLPDGLALFFPDRGDASPAIAAKAICHGCPVRIECLDYAIAPPKEAYGIWGGLSVKERRSHLKVAAVRADQEACTK